MTGYEKSPDTVAASHPATVFWRWALASGKIITYVNIELRPQDSRRPVV